MCAQLAQGWGRRAAAPPCQLLRQHFDRAVHADGEHFFDIGQVRIKRPMLDIGAKAANRRLDRLAIIGMRAHQSRQCQKFDRALQRQAFCGPSFWQAGAGRFWVVGSGLALLHIGAKPPRAQRNFHPIGICAQNAPIHRSALFTRNWAGIATVRIIAAANKGPPRARGFQMQPPRPAGLANARIAAIFAQRIQMRG